MSAQTFAQLGISIALIVTLLMIEPRVSHPLVPLRMFALRNVATANVVGVLWAAALFAWFFISALYMQRLLNYSAMQVGLALLPANIIMLVFSLRLSAKLVMRFGIWAPLSLGLLVAAVGLVLFARASAGHFRAGPIAGHGADGPGGRGWPSMAAMSDVA
jgi:hypothetical protein